MCSSPIPSDWNEATNERTVDYDHWNLPVKAGRGLLTEPSTLLRLAIVAAGLGLAASFVVAYHINIGLGLRCAQA